MRFKLGDTIHYLCDGLICSAPIFSRVLVENIHDDCVATKTQKFIFTPFGASGVYYGTYHGVFPDSEVFSSRKELIESILEKEG